MMLDFKSVLYQVEAWIKKRRHPFMATRKNEPRVQMSRCLDMSDTLSI